MSVHWPIIRGCLLRPTRIAVIDDDRSWRAVELVVGALHLARHVESACRTETLGVMLPTCGAFPMAALAGWMLGKTVVPLNYLLKPDELVFVVQDCGTDTVVSAGPMLEFVGSRPRVPNVLELDRLKAQFRGVPKLRWPAGSRDDALAVLLYTSGTSGRPKGVMLTHGNLAANIRQIRAHVDFTRRDRLLGVLPQFHSFGLTVLTLLPLTVGCPVVYSARFVPHRILKLIREHRPTTFIAIPSMYGALLHLKDAKPEDFASLRYIVSGGEPLPAAIFEGFRERFGVTINEGYGLTETAPVTNWCRPSEWRAGSVGPALPGIDQRIVDAATGRVLGPNEDGEVRMKGPNVMPGYFNRPEETASAFDEHGYLKTGDMGRLDADRHLYITGRIKEMLIVGGENVFPREIEEVLDKHPSVNASAVIGVRDDVRGELPWAFVEMKEGQVFEESALRTWCRERLAGYKVPREIRAVEKLPRNPTGKIMRRELKKVIG